MSKNRSAGLVLLLLAASPAAFSQSTVLVSSFGAIPSDGIDDSGAIQAALNSLSMVPAPRTLLFNLPGEYEVTGPPGTVTCNNVTQTAVLALCGVDDVTITAVTNVTILLTGYDRSATTPYPDVLKVYDCDNFHLTGASASSPLVFTMREANPQNLTNEGLSFLQGTLVSVDTQDPPKSAVIKVTDPGMRLPSSCVPSVWGVWEVIQNLPGLNAKFTGGGTATATVVLPISSNFQYVKVEFSSAGAGQIGTWTIGNTIVVLLNDSETYAVTVTSCDGTVVLQDLLAYHLPGSFVRANGHENCHTNNVDVKPRLTSRKLSIPRGGLVASGHTLLIEYCDMLFCGDDGIVAQGSSYGVPEPGSFSVLANEFQLDKACAGYSGPTSAEVGESMVLLDPATLSSSSQEEAVITKKSWTGPVDAEWIYTYGFETPGFEARLWSAAGGFTYNPWYSIQGAVVQNCTVKSDRGVGITVRGVNTQVLGCTIERVTVCGIHAGGGMACLYPWGGAGSPPHSLVIQGCILNRAGGFVEGQANTGSIEVAVALSSMDIPPYSVYPVYSTAGDVILDVTIDGNTIQNAPRAGLFVANIGGSQGILVTNNTFQSCGDSTPNVPAEQYAVAIETCSVGGGSGNTWVNCPNQVYYHNSPGISIY